MRIALALWIAITLTACAAGGQRRLYDDLGGAAGIEAMVEGLLFKIVDDPRISHHFANVDVLRLREKLIEQICVEAQGPCTYTGDDMQIAHAGRQITEAEFNALVEDLIEVMQEQKIPVAAQNRLLQRLAAMQRDIVYQ
jgi:hemoglobin